VRETADPVSVACRRLDTALREAALAYVDLLKLDIEGAEFGVLASGRALEGIDAIVAELHFDYVPERGLREVLEACVDFRVDVAGDSSGRMTLVARRVEAHGPR
jgi:hypothetical protein